MSDDSADKRRFARVPISLPVNGKCKRKIFKTHLFEGQSQNISYDGLCLQASTNGFRVGEKVRFATKLYNGDFSIKAKGEICWISSQDDPQWPYNIGIKLTNTRHYRLWCKKVDEVFSEIQ